MALLARKRLAPLQRPVPRHEHPKEGASAHSAVVKAKPPAATRGLSGARPRASGAVSVRERSPSRSVGADQRRLAGPSGAPLGALALSPRAGTGPRQGGVATEGRRAIAAPRKHWFERSGQEAAIYAVELEEQRARNHRLHLSLYGGSHPDVSLHCDALHVEITAQDGVSLLYLNLPYDLDKVHGRLGQRFLERWTAAPLPGEGILMFLVPFYALEASATGFRAFRIRRASCEG